MCFDKVPPPCYLGSCCFTQEGLGKHTQCGVEETSSPVFPTWPGSQE